MSNGVFMQNDLNNEKRYYKQLKKFEDKCNLLIDEGQPYLTVILCHELYRFCDPVEPYANFIHNNPVPFMNRHIDHLISLANHFSEVIRPYPIKMSHEKHKYEILKNDTSEINSSVWKTIDKYTLTEESFTLLKSRLPDTVINSNIKGKRVLDMGCGSGRYSIALAAVGAKKVMAIDSQNKSYALAKEYCRANDIPVEFQQGNILCSPFKDDEFDFVFCNRLHHTGSINQGLDELYRILNKSGRAFLYIYGSGGIFWTSRVALRRIFKKIPLDYTRDMLNLLGMPPNRNFCDIWYIPEVHTKKRDLEQMLKKVGFRFQSVVSKNSTDLDYAIANESIPNAKNMWGDGEHRYILNKK